MRKYGKQLESLRGGITLVLFAATLPFVGLNTLLPAIFASALFMLPLYGASAVVLVGSGSILINYGFAGAITVGVLVLLGIGLYLLMQSKLSYRSILVSCAVTIGIYMIWTCWQSAIATSTGFFESEVAFLIQTAASFGIEITYDAAREISGVVIVGFSLIFAFITVLICADNMKQAAAKKNAKKTLSRRPPAPIFAWALSDNFTWFALALILVCATMLILKIDNALLFSYAALTAIVLPLCAQGAGVFFLWSGIGCFGKFVGLIWIAMILFIPTSLLVLPVVGAFEQFARTRKTMFNSPNE